MKFSALSMLRERLGRRFHPPNSGQGKGERLNAAKE